MPIETMTITAPACWASAFVNGDFSGLDELEYVECSMWIKAQKPWTIVDVERAPETGDPRAPRFTWSFRLHGGNANGGEVLSYIAHKIETA